MLRLPNQKSNEEKRQNKNKLPAHDEANRNNFRFVSHVRLANLAKFGVEIEYRTNTHLTQEHINYFVFYQAVNTQLCRPMMLFADSIRCNCFNEERRRRIRLISHVFGYSTHLRN